VLDLDDKNEGRAWSWETDILAQSPSGVDWSQIEERLRLTPTERLERMRQFLVFLEGASRHGKQGSDPVREPIAAPRSPPGMIALGSFTTMLRLRYLFNGEERVVSLSSGRIRIGRGSDNDVVLSDVSVSRYHAEILREREGWSVHDLKSTNGVEVNRVPVEKAPLRAGDLLGIGSFELRLEEEEAAPPPRPAHEESGSLEALGNATIIRPLADFAAAYGLSGKPPAPVQEAAGDQAYVQRMFGFLTRLARMLTLAESVDDVLARVLDLAFEAFPVDRGFILLSDDSGELVCELARVKDRVQFRPSGEVPVSRTMLRTVMNERVALVTFDAQSDQRLSGGESIRMHQIRSAMCAPLWSGERIMGVIQVDSPFTVGAYGERDLDVLTTLANYVAVAVERIRYAKKAEFERQVRSRLERYHSPGVIEEVLRRGDEGMRRLQTAEATVLFADLVGFTSFAENAPPERVAESIDAFLDLSVEAIFRAGGTLDKFIGDCVMAFFGAPVAQPDHAERAVRAAVEIQEGLAAWNARRAAEGLPGFKARVALNSGPVVVGDIGSARRVDYTVLGNTVNVASRLEGATPPGEVVIGPETHRLLNGTFRTEPYGELALKGLQQKIPAYRVVRG
jgi:adenylate cyclase